MKYDHDTNLQNLPVWLQVKLPGQELSRLKLVSIQRKRTYEEVQYCE